MEVVVEEQEGQTTLEEVEEEAQELRVQKRWLKVCVLLAEEEVSCQ